MAIQQTTLGNNGTSHTEYRVNPKNRVDVEKRVSANRWQLVERCVTEQDARAVLFRLSNGLERGDTP